MGGEIEGGGGLSERELHIISGVSNIGTLPLHLPIPGLFLMSLVSLFAQF